MGWSHQLEFHSFRVEITPVLVYHVYFWPCKKGPHVTPFFSRFGTGVWPVWVDVICGNFSPWIFSTKTQVLWNQLLTSSGWGEKSAWCRTQTINDPYMEAWYWWHACVYETPIYPKKHSQLTQAVLGSRNLFIFCSDERAEWWFRHHPFTILNSVSVFVDQPFEGLFIRRLSASTIPVELLRS